MLIGWLLVVAVALPSDEPLQAGRDVAMPKRIHYVEPKYPDIAREAGVSGVVLAEIIVKEDGRPQDIQVLEAQPLLDLTALEAARHWQYEPTLVDGRPRRVRVRELIEVFPDRKAATRFFVEVVKNRGQPKPMRIIAAQRLLAGGVSSDAVQQALEQAAKDEDLQISQAAADALRGLREKTGPPR